MSTPERGEGAYGFGLGGLILCLGLGLSLAITARDLGSFLTAGAAAHLLAGLPAWLATAVYALRVRRAREERVEHARLQTLAADGRGQLFSQAGQGDAAVVLRRFERFGIPAAAVALAALQIGLAYALTRWFPREAPQANLTAAAFLCGASFALLLLGRFGFALERQGVHAAGAGGRLAISGSLATFVTGAALAAQVQLGVEQVDGLGVVFVGIGVVLGVEALLLLLLEAYRPRRAGQVVRPPYDSRLLGLISAPADIARSIARAVDYQFGFGLSQTWFYRFLERWIVPLIGFTVVSFWALSALTVVHAHQAGLLFRLGKLHPAPLEPGIHLHLPWPFDHVELLEAGRLQQFQTGHVVGAGLEREEEEDDGHGHGHDDDDHDADEGGREEVLLWSEAHVHSEEDLVLIARAGAEDEESPVNLLAASATLDYRVADPLAYARGVADPEAMLDVLAEREVTRLLCSADFDALLTRRGVVARQLAQRMAQRAEQHALGVEIVDAAFLELHPPVEVGPSFEEVTRALEESRASVLGAQAQALASVPLSEQQAAAIRSAARAEARARIVNARAGAGRFAVLRTLDAISPRVFRLERLLDELVAGAGPARKIVLGRASAVTDLNLEDRVRAADTPLQGLLDEQGDGEDEE